MVPYAVISRLVLGWATVEVEIDVVAPVVSARAVKSLILGRSVPESR